MINRAISLLFMIGAVVGSASVEIAHCSMTHHGALSFTSWEKKKPLPVAGVNGSRTPSRYVGSVMAVLGTFHEAGVLPPEADPRANQLIRSLIQFQSVFLKSEEPVVQNYFDQALHFKWGSEGPVVGQLFHEQGWTAKSLEALVDYSLGHSMWEAPKMIEVLQSHNLHQRDWELIQKLFLAARQGFETHHQDFHVVFAEQRRKFPGGQVPPLQ